jgi:hypothetical protein
MGLIDLKTDLKSLRYGKDRLGGGSSNQPYIKSKIPTNEGDLGAKGGPDFLLRGGLLTPGRILKDTSRLTQMFFDFKSPNGLLFTAKQNVLSRTAVATNVEGKALNNGVYLPTSTILGAAGNPIGLHLNKQGINPFAGIYTGNNSFLTLISDFDPLGNPVYSSLVNVESKSRLEDFLNSTIKKEKESNLYNYSGGPGSILGVGKTNIPLLLPRDRTGINNPNLNYTPSKVTWASSISFAQTTNFSKDPTNGKFIFSPTTNPFTTDSLTTGASLNNQNNTSYTPSKFNFGPITKREEGKEYLNFIDNDRFLRTGASVLYSSNKFILTGDVEKIKAKFQSNGKAYNPPTVYKEGTLENNSEITGKNTLSQEEIAKLKSSKLNPEIQEDFRKTSNPTLKPLNYTSKNIEYRVNLGNPGMKGDITDYQKGKLLYGSNLYKPLDRITALPLYKSENVDTTKPINDLVKFRIGVIDNNNPTYKTYIHFRAFIDSMSDSYSADWQSQKFMGRGENFYRYNGFDRKVSLSWTVVAQSKAELMPMYQKLNYLASVCAPDYSDLGYMRGNLIKLTIGGYLCEQVGIMTSITYDVPQESPWEIAIPSSEASSDSSNTSGFLSDNSVKELPHMIKVTGFQFIPIHNFVPSVQKNSFTEDITKKEENKNGEIITKVLGTKGKLDVFGNQKYIALSNRSNDDNYKIINPPVSPIFPIQQKPLTPLKTSTPLSTEIII